MRLIYGGNNYKKKDNWYLLIPLNIIQMTGFSDIEKRMTNYSNVMLKYNK